MRIKYNDTLVEECLAIDATESYRVSDPEGTREIYLEFVEEWGSVYNPYYRVKKEEFRNFEEAKKWVTGLINEVLEKGYLDFTVISSLLDKISEACNHKSVRSK